MIDSKNKIWHLINSIGLPVILVFCWQYIAVPQIEKIRDNGNFISIETAGQLIKESILEQREKQADEKTASLSWTVANALGVEREQVAPRITKLIQFGEAEMIKHVERQAFWQEFEKTRYIAIIEKEGKLYFRWTDGDYQLKKKEINNGFVYYWRDKNDDKHYLQSISSVKDQ